MIVYNYILASLCILFPFLVGSIFYKNKPFCSSSWICGIMLIAYFILIAKGLNLEHLYFKIFIALLILLLIINFISAINYNKNWLKNFKTIINAYLNVNLNWLSILTICIVLLMISIVLLIFLEAVLNVIRHPISAGDALACWYLKARSFYEWVNFENFPYVHYPSLGSAIWYYTLLFFKEEYFGRIFFIIIFTIFIYDFFKTLSHDFEIEKKYKILLGISIISLYSFGMTERFGGNYTFLYAGYMDWLVALLISYSYYKLFINFFKNLSNGKKDLITKSSILPLFLLGCAGLVKEEGIYFALICLFSYFFITFLYSKKINFNSFIKLIAGSLLTIFIFSTYKFLIIINGLNLKHVQGFTNNSILQNISKRIFDIDAVTMTFKFFYLSIIYNYEIS